MGELDINPKSGGIEMDNPFKVGDLVYRNFPFDGSPKQGYPDTRRVFRIVKISDGQYIDGNHEKDAVCYLEPGAWEFHWNLTSVERK